MKKAKTEMRAEYKRSDFAKLERGKYAKRIAAGSNVVVIDPVVAKALPNEASVNAALRGLIDLAKASTRKSVSNRTSTKTVRAD